MHSRTRFLLKQIGLSERELSALALDPIHEPLDLPTGFGLIGSTGVGKTWCLARRIGLTVQAQVEGAHDPSSARLPNRFARWRNWPDMAEVLKNWVSQDWGDDVAELVDVLSTCRELYLDDLGQERIAKADDYSLGFLRNILDARYRDNLPVFWTSNLTPTALNQVYGARTVSRLLSAWPAVLVKGPDLRLGGRAS